MTCRARYCGNQMICERCGLAWDVNDREMPQCRTDRQIDDAVCVIELQQDDIYSDVNEWADRYKTEPLALEELIEIIKHRMSPK